MSPELTDEEIILSYKNGNGEAFKQLIERYTPLLHNYIFRRTHTPDTKDILQDVFIKTWKNILHFDETKASFKTWIFTIAKNIIIDFQRKSGSASGGKKSINFSDIKNIEQEDVEDFAQNIQADDLLPDEALQKLQDIEFLNRTLEKLNPVYQEILELHYQEEMTFEEIGKILGKPLNTVKSQHQRAIVELRKILS
jgi:RNA polymerase sigma-70 factor, ECF subfamily